nr:sigma 54-interacting transcriptional regulator [Oscillochloris sp. ZM17-4]
MVVDDDAFDNTSYCTILRQEGYQVYSARSIKEAATLIERVHFDAALVDMLLVMHEQGQARFGGLVVIKQLKARDATTQVITVTAFTNHMVAAEAMLAGAMGFIEKEAGYKARLPMQVQMAVLRAREERETMAVAPLAVERDALATPVHLIANSAAMQAALARAQALAPLELPVLISGEPGVGKELIANIIHSNSPFRAGPFMTLSCLRISATLVELWGDALNPDAGLCARADGGTLMLEEIDKLPFGQQMQLAALVKEHAYQRPGTPGRISVNLRFVFTTTASLKRLEQLERQGRFHKDLLALLKETLLIVPSLRDRRDADDVLAIAGHMLQRYGLATNISPEALELLAAHDYAQGNLKELEEILREAASHTAGGVIEAAHLPEVLRTHSANTATKRIDTSDNRVHLTVRFAPGDPPLLLWDSFSGGTANSYLQLPFTRSDLSLIVHAIEAVQQQRMGRATSDIFSADEQSRLVQYGLWFDDKIASRADERLGRMLFNALFAEPVARTTLDVAQGIAMERSLPLTLTLRFSEGAADLAALPWELLWSERQPLLLGQRGLDTSCLRYLELPEALPPAPTTDRKLQLLFVCPRSSLKDEDSAVEEGARQQALQPLTDSGVVVEELYPARLSKLTDRLQDRQPVDILHFYGHSFWRDDKAYLQFEDRALNARQAATLLASIPVIVLNTSRKGHIHTSDLVTSIASMLSMAGVVTVIVMQFSLDSEAAARFSEIFYRGLAGGETIQQAVTNARQALYVEYDDGGYWYSPAVYLRSRCSHPLVIT